MPGNNRYETIGDDIRRIVVIMIRHRDGLGAGGD